MRRRTGYALAVVGLLAVVGAVLFLPGEMSLGLALALAIGSAVCLLGGALIGWRGLGWTVLLLGATSAYAALRAHGHEAPPRYWASYLVVAAVGIFTGLALLGISSPGKQDQ